ncbi:phospholipid scramblase 1-like isoform X1 [Cyprinus carpio]|uniref:Phospholipid scramblase 1-like isoform X1 n=1 Tax=Cyprinus carpio TaxID=7962 RepID=A0A9Q9WHC7_CYPCA|nr:phospholipid scramblase 1-like isoform X1 [Cyprinus carpio]XP_042583425.1 phospholipid scramblase 1-like isoform X1 [Cyprinus carpio]
MSEPGYPAQNDLPNPMPQSEGPAPATPAPGLQTDDQSPPDQPPLNQSEPIYEVDLGDHEELTYMCPDPAPPPAGLQPENQALPVQTVMDPSVPMNAVPYVIQPYKGYPVQRYLPYTIPQTAGPGPVPPAAGLEPENQALPVQTVMNQPGSSNPAPHQVQSYTGCPAQNDFPNPMPQSEGPAPATPAPGLQTDDQLPPVQPPLNQSEPIYEDVFEDHEEHKYMCPDLAPPPAGLQPENQALPVQTVMNQPGSSNPAPHQVQSYTVGYPAQNYPPYAIAQSAGPGPVPLATGLEPQNQPLPVQTVMNPPGPGNPAPHQVQSYTGYPMPQSEVIELQSENQPHPVQSDPSNPALHQVLPYAAPAVPPPFLLFGVPPGLEYLTQINQILIHQKIECIQILSGYETNNQYEIKNSIGQEIYHVKEESDCLIRNLFGPAHGFKMHIKDSMDQEVIQLHRPMRCFLQEIEVQAPPGVIIGYVKQEWSFLPKFTILGPNYEELLKIQGPLFPFIRCDDVDFEVKGIIGEQSVGRITKQQSGLLKSCITDASNFCIQFPLDLDVKMKAVLLGACLLIDIMCFDKGAHLLLKLLRLP